MIYSDTAVMQLERAFLLKFKDGFACYKSKNKRGKVMDRLKKASLVIADDEPILRMDLREMLEDQGYEVVGEAPDGFDAIEICRKTHPDLVFLDIKMPIVGGLEAAKVINEGHLADAIIMLTAFTSLNYVEQAKQNGVWGYLVKPISERDLMPAIEIALRRSQESKQLNRQIQKVENRLKHRIQIERAKGYLMDKGKCSEDKAYHIIRQLSREKNVPMEQVASVILQRVSI